MTSMNMTLSDPRFGPFRNNTGNTPSHTLVNQDQMPEAIIRHPLGWGVWGACITDTVWYAGGLHYFLFSKYPNKIAMNNNI